MLQLGVPLTGCFKKHFLPDLLEKSAWLVVKKAGKLNEKYNGLLNIPLGNNDFFYNVMKFVRNNSSDSPR